MRNSDYPYNYEKVHRAWHAFRYEAPDPVWLSAIDPVVLRSWQRCEQLFDDANAQPSDTSHSPYPIPHEDLVAVAVPYLEDIHQFIQDTPNTVFLTDNQGRVLALEGRFHRDHKVSMNIGESWREDRIGTNAVALSLITAMPTQVVGAEHYLQIFHSIAESAAPIHDEAGVITGTIAILTTTGGINPAHLALVMTTARAITNQLQANLNLEQTQRRARQLHVILESVTDGVITWNNDGHIDHANSVACHMLSVRNSAMLGKHFHDLMAFPDYVQEAIDACRSLNTVESRIQIGDRILQCVISIRPMLNPSGERTGGVLMLRRLAEVRSLVNQQTNTFHSITFEDHVYESKATQDLLRQAQIAAKGSAGVLLIGEVGVGKSVIARAIHSASPRSAKPFVVVSGDMVPSEFMQEELLGREARGNEPGRPSKFELADGGTLLIDRIDQFSLESQHIILHVMTSRNVQRLQATRPTTVNVRVIATATPSIEAQLKNGSFLPQLYYLFNAFRLVIPPLRERRKDIPKLVHHILNRSGGSQSPCIEPDALEQLMRYPWPGNTRELENVIERAVVQATGGCISRLDLPDNIRKEQSFVPGTIVPQRVLSLSEAERETIVTAGWACHGVISDMAELLGINRTTLWRKFKEHGLSAADFKQGSPLQESVDGLATFGFTAASDL